MASSDTGARLGVEVQALSSASVRVLRNRELVFVILI
jgi:hypothetical protein